MRKIISYILVLLLVSAQSLAAAPAKKKSSAKEWKGANRNIHHVAIWGGGGYSGLVNGYQNNRFVGGGGGIIGIGYEYKYDHFILNVGPEFRIFTSQDNITFPTPYDVSMMADGYSQTKHYTFTSTMREDHTVGQVMLPIMAGGKWDKWYFLAGAKIGYTLLGNYKQKSTLTTTITDHDAYDPTWENMANHGAITDAPYAQKGKNDYGFDVTLSAEGGLNINGFLSEEWNDRNKARKHPLFMRIGAFLDYGLMNLAKGAEGPMAIVDENSITTRSLHRSEWANGRLNSLLVGIKFTALLQMNKPQPPKPQKPEMMIYVSDIQTDKAIASATVEVTPQEVKKPRTVRKTTNSKGMVMLKTAAGPYQVHVTHPDYTALDHDYSHGELGDTLSLAMTPRPDFRFYVRDAKSDSLMASAVTFINTADEATIAAIETDSITGYANLRLPINTSLRIHIEAANHLSLTLPVGDIGGEETYRLEPIVKKRAIILHNLFFATNQTTILPESESALQDLFDMLNENPDIRIRITGHTDNVGSDRANQKLSEGRANSVRNDLIKRGINGDRIEAEGKGESQPIDTNDTEEGRQNNRRVEFMIL